MIKNIYLDGKIHTMLVLDEDFEEAGSPLYSAIEEQEIEIDKLIKQNETLVQQNRALLALLELKTALNPDQDDQADEGDFIIKAAENTLIKSIEKTIKEFDEQ